RSHGVCATSDPGCERTSPPTRTAAVSTPTSSRESSDDHGRPMTVYLVGAGPGDPGLITARGLGLVRMCDALLFDRLVSADLVAEAPRGAIRIGRDQLEQAAMNDLLVRLGRRGLEVVRLKGGDPFVFGRGGEEALAPAAAGVSFE